MTDRETMQQALEALEELDGLDTETECVTIDVSEVITALREALEQPEKEPVAMDWQQGSVPLGGNGCSIVSQKTIPFEFRQPAAQPAQEPTPWRDMVVVTLVREGINKHKARELADHFAAQPAQEPVAWTTMPEAADWDFVSGSKDPTGKLEGKWFPLYTTPPAAQRPWQGLTPEEIKHLYPYGRSVWGKETFEAIEKALKERNT